MTKKARMYCCFPAGCLGTRRSTGEADNPLVDFADNPENPQQKTAQRSFKFWNRKRPRPHPPYHHNEVVVESSSDFENENQRVTLLNSWGLFGKEKEQSQVAKKVVDYLLKPRGWEPPTDKKFFLDLLEIVELCETAEAIFQQESPVLQLCPPMKIFGDLHGQFRDLMRLFDEYGCPSTTGDIAYIDYLFLGDYVDRGQHGLETITLLLALKIFHPRNIHMIRGNHELMVVNSQFGFKKECIERLGDHEGRVAWERFNQLFSWVPLAALIGDKVLCVHGGIGRSIKFVQQIGLIQRPIMSDSKSIALTDLLWSDPTENDSVEGFGSSHRGPGIVTFGPDVVMEFCKRNGLELIIRAHECVMDGFERFAQGHLITLFSATNYCGTVHNAGAILVLGRDMVVVPKLIHPLPPGSLASDGEDENMWMQEINLQCPPTPARGVNPNLSETSVLALA